MSNTICILGIFTWSTSGECPLTVVTEHWSRVGQIIGVFTSFGFQHVKNPAFAGWRIMFTVLGLVTVLVGIATYLMIPDNPMKTKWLSSNGKAAVLQHVSINKTGISEKQLKLSQVLELLLDPQMHLLTVMLLLVSPPGRKALIYR
jgi:sugar phosphate permease